VALLPILVLATACGTGAKDSQSVIVRRLEGEPKTLNPILATTDAELAVLALVSRNLLDYDSHLDLMPGLAESIESDPAHLVYTVKLKPGLRWEDGSEIRASDVVFTLRLLMDPKTPSPNRKGFFEGFEKAEAVDDLTARVTFKSASSARRDAFNLPLLPEKHYKNTDLLANPMNRQPLANGPYKVARWKSGQSIDLIRNTQFSGPLSPAEKLVFRIVPDSGAAYPALLNGEIHDARLTFAQMQDLKKKGAASATASVLLYPELGYTYIGWSHKHPLFVDREVRRALTRLIDREAIARTIYGGTATPAAGPIPPGLWFHDPAIAPLAFDPAAAAQALSAAGFARGKDGVLTREDQRFSFKLSMGSGSEIQRQIAEFVQQEFRKAGIEMTLEMMEWSAFTTRVDAGDFEACFLAMSLDPNPDFSISWHSAQLPPGGWNYYYYSNPEVDRTLDQLKATFEKEEARKLYSRLQHLLNEDQPVTFLHNVQVKWGLSKRIEGVTASPLGLSLFWPGASSWRPVAVSRPVS
jgi:peptide/nickel transport system substrate-binding protein